MKIIAVMGSPREKGNSASVAYRILEGAADAGCEVKIYKVSQMVIAGCHACGACRSNDTDCVIMDDMEDYFCELRKADALILAAPNYYGQICGPMITFMNRHYCLLDKTGNSRLDKKILLAGVFSQGAPENYDKYSDVYDWFLNCFTSKNMELTGKIVTGGDSDLQSGGRIMTDAYEMGYNMKK